jgi:hypothetical protein
MQLNLEVNGTQVLYLPHTKHTNKTMQKKSDLDVHIVLLILQVRPMTKFKRIGLCQYFEEN